MTRRVKKPPVVARKPTPKPAPVVIPPVRPHVFMTSFGGSPDGVLPFINCRFLPGWGTTDFAAIADEIRRTVAAGVTSCSLYVDWLCWDNSSGRYLYRHTEAMPNLFALCDALRARDVLKYVKFWWLPDEPCRDKRISDSDFAQCAVDLRLVSKRYPDLKDVGYIVIWGDERDRRPAKELMTGQGLDDYGRGAGILDAYPDLERDMTPEQFSVVVPGMYTLEHKPMVIEEFLQRWPARCRMMCVFLYDPAQGGYSVNGSASRVMAVANEVKRMNAPGYVAPSQLPASPNLVVTPEQSADDINAPYRNSGGQQG